MLPGSQLTFYYGTNKEGDDGWFKAHHTGWEMVGRGRKNLEGNDVITMFVLVKVKNDMGRRIKNIDEGNGAHGANRIDVEVQSIVEFLHDNFSTTVECTVESHAMRQTKCVSLIIREMCPLVPGTVDSIVILKISGTFFKTILIAS